VISFSVVERAGEARAGVLRSPHGDVPTPAFMPVGTRAAVKGLTPADLRASGATILLCNAYHLMQRPGAETIRAAGGLHRFMAWNGPILTDSGGYQVLSLGPLVRIDDKEATFRSHIDGSTWRLAPETAVELQAKLGVDIAMALDHCPAGDAPPGEVAEATARTTRWAERGLAARPTGLALFGIVQGGADAEARIEHAATIGAMPFDGLAVGGLGVGEPADRTREMIERVAPRLPSDRPRYLMGLGTPEDIALAVGAGFDLFDCVIPTREARHGVLYTSMGKLHIGNARHKDDPSSPDPACRCETCTTFSRAYLRHLWKADEILWHRLATLHNIRFFLDHLARLRARILAGEPPGARGGGTIAPWPSSNP
jgi:queuine tRNA-ribosyltransferase